MIASGDKMKNRINGYDNGTISDDHYRSPSIEHNQQALAQAGGLVGKTTDSIVALAKEKPVVVVFAGVAAGLLIGWLTKRNR